jgi:hypothetical protein
MVNSPPQLSFVSPIFAQETIWPSPKHPHPFGMDVDVPTVWFT